MSPGYLSNKNGLLFDPKNLISLGDMIQFTMLDLAAMPGFEGAIIKLRMMRNANPDARVPKDPYQHCLNQFFLNLTGEISSAWPGSNQPVSIFYDWTDDPKWRRSIMDAHDAARKKDALVRELTFANKKDAPHLPLQAADMVAYRFRQLSETYMRGTIPVPNRLDKLILDSMFNQFRSIPGLPKF
jgi:hypothetical protein